MNVLIVPSWYEARSGAQLGSFFREQALALKRAGCNVIVADASLQAMCSLGEKKLFNIQKKNDEGLLTYSYHMPSFGLMRIPRIAAKIYTKNLKKLFRAICDDGHEIDIIHAHSFYCAGIGAVRLGKKIGVPVIVTEHSGAIISRKLNSAKADLLKETVENCCKFICVGNELKNAVIEYTHTNKNIIIIPNMVDRIFTYQDNKQSEFFNFISIGNLIQSKRFDLTIKAFAKKFKNNSNVKLKIIGDGPLKNELQSLTKECDIESQVVFTGRIDRDKVAKELQTSNVLVLASDFETFGVVYIEAMACGNPVIGTQNGGAVDIITNECGLVVDKNDVDKLAEAMQTIFTKYNLYDKKYISNSCTKKFGEKSIVSRIISTYNEILKER